MIVKVEVNYTEPSMYGGLLHRTTELVLPMDDIPKILNKLPTFYEVTIKKAKKED